MKNKRKQAIYIAVFVLATGFTAWIWFSAGSGPPPVPDSVIEEAFRATQELIDEEAGLGIGSPRASGLLPFGSTFDVDLFSDEKFLELKATAELVVAQEELGQDNPFSASPGL